jgi:mannitol-1-phosphate 5-dehydrogenase
MKAVMYGAGNIGRGFIAQKFYLSGYDTTFIDVNEEVVNAINAAHEYPIYVTGKGGYDKQLVKNVDAVNGKDVDAVVDAIANCDIIATALGANIIKFVAPNIAKAIVKRFENGAKPLNILICENLIGSNVIMHDYVAEYIPENCKEYLENSIGFVCVCVGRTVPKAPDEFTKENMLAVCTEPYSKLPADSEGFRPVGAEYPPIKGLIPFSPFKFFIEQKLLMHNMAHAMSAYLGYIKGYTRIPDVEVDAEIKYLITRAILEAARALSKKHGASLDDNLQFFEDLIIRFENKLLDDTMLRVGKDTKRKLSASDRLGGAFKIVREQGMVPAHIAIGIAAGFHFDHPEDPIALETSSYAKENGIAAALEKYCDITDAADVEMVSKFYDMLGNKATFAELCEALSDYKYRD